MVCIEINPVLFDLIFFQTYAYIDFAKYRMQVSIIVPYSRYRFNMQMKALIILTIVALVAAKAVPKPAKGKQEVSAAAAVPAVVAADAVPAVVAAAAAAPVAAPVRPTTSDTLSVDDILGLGK